MDIIDALVKRLVEDEDLIKGATGRQVKRMLEHLANAKNQNLSPEQRQRALEQVQYMAQTGKEQRSATDRATKLDKLMSNAKGKTASAADKKLAEIAARANIRLPEKKQQEAPATPGSDATLTQLETSARRARRDPNAISDDKYDIPTIADAAMDTKNPAKAKRMMQNKVSSQAREAIEQVNKLHGIGDVDSAHELYSAIPKNILPKDLHDYNPDYMHYGVHPNMWSQITNPEHRQDMHNIHKQAMAGELDNHPDYKNVIPKLKASKIPKPPA